MRRSTYILFVSICIQVGCEAEVSTQNMRDGTAEEQPSAPESNMPTEPVPPDDGKKVETEIEKTEATNPGPTGDEIPENSAPVLVVSTFELFGVLKGTLPESLLQPTDKDQSADTLTFELITAPGHGSLSLGEDSLGEGDAFTFAEFKELELSYSHSGNGESDLFKVALKDAEGAYAENATTEAPAEVKIQVTGWVSDFAGDGTAGLVDDTGRAARFQGPRGIVVDKSGNVFVADYDNHRIRKITPEGEVSTFAGSGATGWPCPGSSDGTGTGASFCYPYGITIDKDDNLYVADDFSGAIRKITPAGVVTTLVNGGYGRVFDVAVTGEGVLYFASFGNSKVYKLPVGGSVEEFATGLASPHSLALDADDNVWIADTGNHRIVKVTPDGTLTVVNEDTTKLSSPVSIRIGPDGAAYVSNFGMNLISKVTPTGEVTTFAGDGTDGYANGVLESAAFKFDYGHVAFSPDGNMYLSDTTNNRIRFVRMKP